jgi:drug/metabolite transporter (DMT)-like permease
MAIVIAIGAATGRLGQARTQRIRLHAFRNLAHFAGQNLWFFAITVIPLAQVFALEFTTPIWAIFLSALFLGERITRFGVIAAALGFLGILLVARPEAGGVTSGIIAAAVAAVAFATTAVCTRSLTRTETIFTIMFWLTVLQAIFGLVFAGIDGDIAAPSAATAPWLLLIACAGLLAHFCLTNALSIAPASIVMPLDFARLPVVAIVGMILYDEPLELIIFLGAALIFLGNYINITRGQILVPAPSASK